MLARRRPPAVSLVWLAAFLALLPLSLAASFSTTELTRSAERVFRGRCVEARPGTIDFKGRPLAATVYTFEVSEYLKGDGPRRLTFRQAGTPERSVTDLGRIAGLTVFAPGTEYLVFLRPVSRAGLTSAAGRGRGVFLVTGSSVQAADLDGRTPVAGAETLPYDALRRAILQVLAETP
jgi:hypothetical protein